MFEFVIRQRKFKDISFIFNKSYEKQRMKNPTIFILFGKINIFNFLKSIEQKTT